jgi:hypothetical protein
MGLQNSLDIKSVLNKNAGMEIQTEILQNNALQNSNVDTQNIMNLNKFIFLCIISFGTYQIWWFYKSWKFFKQKDNLDINPIARSLFGIIFFHSLLNEILDFAYEKNYSKCYSPSFLFFGLIVSNLLAKLPDPFWLISTLSFLFLVPPFMALNFAKLNSTDFTVIKESKFNPKQIVLTLIGVIFWGLVLLGLNSENTI